MRSAYIQRKLGTRCVLNIKERNVDEFTLSNGLRVVGERIPHIRSVSIGVWVKAGSMLESPEQNGLSHLMEHMAFKGTNKRTARQIAEEMDAVGGYLNAATGKLCTSYYAKVIDCDLPLAADMLADIIIDPLIDEKELEKERGVVLEEISMVDDSPEDVVYDALAEAVFGEQSLGMTILGARENIARYTREDLCAFRALHYGPRNAVLAIAGNYELDAMRALMEEKFGGWQGAPGERYPLETPCRAPEKKHAVKDVEQAHLCLGYPGKPLGSPDVYAMAVMNSILGGGMSSRLFQRVREELGLAYSIYSAPSAYPFCGDFTIYAAVSPKQVKNVIAQIDIEIEKFLSSDVTEKELSQAKAQLRGGFVLGQESAYNRMNAMGNNMMLLSRYVPMEETLDGIARVTMEDMLHVARETLTATRCIALVGRKGAGKGVL